MMMARPSLREGVLLVRLSGVGDFILWLDAAKAFHELFPGKKITLLANRAWAELARELPHWDEVWDVDRNKLVRNPLYRLRTFLRLRRAGFQIVIQTGISRDFYHDTVVRISGADKRIGSVGDHSNIRPWQKWISDCWYTRLITLLPETTMELCRNAEFIRGLGLESFQAGLPTLSVTPTHDLIAEDGDYYILFPGGSWPGKQWPVEKFARLADMLYVKTGWKGIICGGPGEYNLGLRISGQAQAPLHNTIGKTSVNDLVVLIKNAQFVVTNDTSAVHIGAAVNTAVVSILWGGQYGRFLPYRGKAPDNYIFPVAVIHEMACFGCDRKCNYQKISNTREPVPCVANVSIENVLQEVLKIQTLVGKKSL
jgi:ADP-heptose:LPS heptosyltransferase